MVWSTSCKALMIDSKSLGSKINFSEASLSAEVTVLTKPAAAIKKESTGWKCMLWFFGWLKS